MEEARQHTEMLMSNPLIKEAVESNRLPPAELSSMKEELKRIKTNGTSEPGVSPGGEESLYSEGSCQPQRQAAEHGDAQ